MLSIGANRVSAPRTSRDRLTQTAGVRPKPDCESGVKPCMSRLVAVTEDRARLVRVLLLVALAAVLVAVVPASAMAPRGSLSQLPGASRDADPVVVTGAQAPALAGTDPTRVVAFRHGVSGWQQVPVQVDERALVAPRTIYNGLSTSTLPLLVYADPRRLVAPGQEDPCAGNGPCPNGGKV